MGNIIFNKIQAYNFSKQMDDQKTCLLAAIEQLEIGVTKTLEVWKSNGETNDRLSDLRQTIIDLHEDYSAFASDFMEALKNIGATYEQSDENVTKSVVESDTSTSGQSIVQSIKEVLDSKSAKPLSQSTNSNIDSQKDTYTEEKGEVTSNVIPDSSNETNGAFDALRSIVEDVVDKHSKR